MVLEGCVAWPEEVAERYRREGYWRGEPLGTLLRRSAARDGEHTALVAGGRRWSYRELDVAADRLAAGLHGLGVRPRDRVVVQLPNVGEFVSLSFALFRLGALPVMALPAYRESEITYLCEASGASVYVIADTGPGVDYRSVAGVVRDRVPGLRHVLVAGERHQVVLDQDVASRPLAGDPGEEPGLRALATVDAAPVDLPPPDPSDVALFLLSGGTTGLPKLIPRTHDDYAYNARASAEVCELTPEDVYLANLPVAHNFPLACPGVLGTLTVGGTVVLSPTPSPDDVFPLMERERVTVTATVPAVALLWMEAAGWVEPDLTSLRLLQVGGSKLGEEAAKRVELTLGCRLQQVMGLAEGLVNFIRAEDPPELGLVSQGRPLSEADEVRVVGEDGQDVPEGEVGELLFRGPYTIRGYYDAPAQNAASIDPDGFFHSGDLVRRLPSGHLIVVGRVKDVINRGGDKIPTEEVENHLLAHPNVREAALVGMPDAVLGERACAFVLPRGQAPSLRDLAAFLADRGVAAFKVPERLEVVTELPRTGVGKVDKQALTRRLEEG